MTWLVTGANGQLGMAFQREIASRGNVIFVNRAACDLASPASLSACLNREQPSVIINCAAYTAVDAAEEDEATATRVNADAVGEMARWAASHDALMVQFSTDYVFDGTAKDPHAEDAPIAPLSVYGRSKAAGEAQFLKSGAKGFCLRTSWVHSNDGHNFFLTMKRLMRERTHLRIVDDQKGVPTTTGFLAETTLRLVDLYRQGNTGLPRLIHAVPGGATSWFGFASYIRDRLIQTDNTAKLAQIEAISSSEFPQAAKRPSNSVLANNLLQSCLGKSVGKWEDWHDRLHDR